MTIFTTIYIKQYLLAKVKNTSKLLNISQNELISLLLLKVNFIEEKEVIIFSTVRYQESCPGKKWERAHVAFREDLYERCLDMRKLYKLSVSLILALAIEKYLNEIIADNSQIIETPTDNYPVNYVSIFKNRDGLKFFTIAWDFPDMKTLTKILNL